MVYIINFMSARKFTTLLLDRIDEGVYDKDTIIKCFCSYCSEHEVHDMMSSNELLFDEDEEME